MSIDDHRTKWRRNIAENFNRLSRVHEGYRETDDRRQTTDRQTDGRRHIVSLRLQKKEFYFILLQFTIFIYLHYLADIHIANCTCACLYLCPFVLIQVPKFDVQSYNS